MFRNLTAEMVRENITIKEMAKHLKITEKTLRNKLSGKTEFTWKEIRGIQEKFFPSISKDVLFQITQTTA